MFENKHLDGEWNRVIPSTDAFLNGDILELRDNLGGNSTSASRRQYGVVGDRLVERCLPPEGLGDRWSYDAADVPWWTSVKNPPHMGIIADFNSYNGGEHRKPLDKAHNVVAFAAVGEEVTFADGSYTVVRQSDNQAISAPTLPELRQVYFAAN